MGTPTASRSASPSRAITASLRTLAERDSREVPAGSMLVAVVGGDIRAAAPVSGEEPISDPFIRSGEIVALLAARVDQLRGRDGRGLRARIGRALGTRSRRGLSPQPAGTLRASLKPALSRAAGG